jgi:hypothetical protein
MVRFGNSFLAIFWGFADELWFRVGLGESLPNLVVASSGVFLR